MAANSPDVPLSAAELQELRRLIAARTSPAAGPGSLMVTLVGVFAAGFLALFGWMAFETYAQGAAIAVLQTDVGRLQADVKNLQAGQEELKAGVAELKAGQRELRALLLEQRRR